MKGKKDYKEHNLFDYVITNDDMNGIKYEIFDGLIDDIRNKNLKTASENRFSNYH